VKFDDSLLRTGELIRIVTEHAEMSGVHNTPKEHQSIQDELVCKNDNAIMFILSISYNPAMAFTHPT